MKLGHWIVLLAALSLATSCAEMAPIPFEKGREIVPPRGFVECKEEGRGC